MQIREILEENGCNTIKIIAKIENAQGVNNIDEILRVSDGIMIARGDMGVEIPLEDVPVIQKMLIQRVYTSGKYVITATQMLDSMMNHPRPTRAEATDVANAIYDGTSVIMLSGETAAGKYPVEAVRTMARIAERTEEDINYRRRFREHEGTVNRDVTNAISHATCSAAYDLEASAIITVTQSGQTARMISKYRPQMPIIGCTTQMPTYRHLSMSWGVVPVLCGEQNTEDGLFKHAMARSKECGVVQDGDLVVITAGVPLGIPGTTNLLKVQTVGDVILHGTGIGEGNIKAGVCVAKSEREALQNFRARRYSGHRQHHQRAAGCDEESLRHHHLAGWCEFSRSSGRTGAEHSGHCWSKRLYTGSAQRNLHSAGCKQRGCLQPDQPAVED